MCGCGIKQRDKCYRPPPTIVQHVAIVFIPELVKTIGEIPGAVIRIPCAILVKSGRELDRPDRENCSWPARWKVRRCATDPSRRECRHFGCRPTNEKKTRRHRQCLRPLVVSVTVTAFRRRKIKTIRNFTFGQKRFHLLVILIIRFLLVCRSPFGRASRGAVIDGRCGRNGHDERMRRRSSRRRWWWVEKCRLGSCKTVITTSDRREEDKLENQKRRGKADFEGQEPKSQEKLS